MLRLAALRLKEHGACNEAMLPGMGIAVLEMCGDIGGCVKICIHVRKQMSVYIYTHNFLGHGGTYRVFGCACSTTW